LDRRFIESSRFPVDVVSEASAKEKQGGGRPKFWEMVFWWTRKPLASARAVIAGALLPEKLFDSEVNVRKFVREVLQVRSGDNRLVGNVPHRLNPSIPREWLKYFRGKRLLDPFAGFGSIPLEGLRLGLDVIAVELLPTAYVFLKAVLEYPVKYGNMGLVKDVERWGRWVTERLREDSDIKELYDPDVAVYIGSWEIKCPHCGRWTPIVGNWWLARVREGSVGEDGWAVYKRLAWMIPKVEGGEVRIDIVDVNRELGANKVRARVDTSMGVVVTGSRSFNVPEPNVHAKRKTVTCLLCGNPIKKIDLETQRHYTDVKGLSKYVINKLVWYVKYALRKYSEGDESLAKPRLFVKVRVKWRSLEFEPATREDNEKLWNAKEKVENLLKEKDPDIPRELISPYENRRITPILGAVRWYQFFNSRQLLTLVKLVKLIREAGKLVEKENLKQGWNKEAFKYAEAVTTYLAIALCKYADYNSKLTRWEAAWLYPKETLAIRGIAMIWNWGESKPFIEMTGTWIRSLRNIVNGLEYLLSAVRDGSGALSGVKQNNSGRAKSIHDDSTVIGKINFDRKFDLIVTDPPYYDDVPYAELSDFYYVWLKRALSEINAGRLVPRFHRDVFFKKVGKKWVEIKTQWEEVAKREVGLNPPRLGPNATLEMGKQHFLNLLRRSFGVMSDRLIDTGMVVSYYAHTNQEAWEALLDSGWLSGGLRITNAFPLLTESAQRVTARGKMALDTSIIVVWRKGVKGEADVDELYRSSIEAGVVRALTLLKNGYRSINLFIGTLSAILTTYTQYQKLIGLEEQSTETLVENLVRNYIYPATALALARALTVYAGREPTKETLRDNTSIFYLLSKILFPRSPRAGRRAIDRSSLTMLSIGTRIEYKTLLDLKIIEKKDSRFYLHEPQSKDLTKLSNFLRKRELDPNQPIIKKPVDALHIVEYYVAAYPQKTYQNKLTQLRTEYPSQVEEALILAKILYRLLPKIEPEYKLIERIAAPTKPLF